MPGPKVNEGEGVVFAFGAGAVIMTTESKAKELGLPILAKIAGWGYAGGQSWASALHTR